MKQYKKYVIPYKSAFILGPIFMIVEVLGEIILPKLMSMIINYGCGQDVTVAAKGPAYIIGIGAAMIGTALLMMMGGVLGAYFAVKASVNFAGDLRRDVFAKVQKFSFANIEKFSTGSLVTRLTNDITNIQNVLSMGLRMLLRAPGMLIGGLIMAFLMNAKLALVFCVVIPVLIIALAFVMKTAFPRFDVMQTKIDGLNSRIQENITNQRVVKSFVRDDFEKETFDRANNELKDKTLRAMKVVILTMPIMTLAMNLTVMAVVWFGGQQILIGDMPVGNLTAFTTYVTQILMSLMMVSMIMIQGSRAMASSHRILEVLDTDIDLNDDNASEKDRLVTSGEIEFKNVCFRYYKKHKKNVLQSIDNLIAENSAVKIMFKISSYKSGNGQSYRKFYMNRDGFSLLAMGFTGREALEWKLQYIRAFNQMENFIREKSTQMWVETRKAGKLTRKAETDTIQKLVEYAKGQGSSHAEMLYMTYSRLVNKMAGINKRDEATVMQLNNLSLMENIILHEVDLGIMQGKHYQEIYRDCKKRLEAVKDLAYLEAV